MSRQCLRTLPRPRTIKFGVARTLIGTCFCFRPNHTDKCCPHVDIFTCTLCLLWESAMHISSICTISTLIHTQTFPILNIFTPLQLFMGNIHDNREGKATCCIYYSHIIIAYIHVYCTHVTNYHNCIYVRKYISTTMKDEQCRDGTT